MLPLDRPLLVNENNPYQAGEFVRKVVVNIKKLTLMIALLFQTESAFAFAFADLPRQLSAADRLRAVEILGFGSSAKILGNPYPLGGYKGVEVGLTSEFIPLDDLSKLGNESNGKGELNFYTLTFGKGLFHNVDVFIHFTPVVQNEDIQNFGGQMRWGFYESNSFPLTLSTSLYGGGANFSNLVNIVNFGFDLLATVTIDQVSVYAGGGPSRAIAKFIGGAGGITDTGNSEEADVLHGHTVFGVSIDISKFFLAMQIDRYADSFYSGKLGYRF